MAIANVQTVSKYVTSTSNTTTVTVASIASGSLLVCAMSWGVNTGSPPSPTSVKGHSGAEVFTQDVFDNFPNNSGSSAIFSFPASAGGYTDIVPLFGANFDFLYVTVTEFSGVSGSSPLDVNGTQAAHAHPYAGPILTQGAAGEVHVAVGTVNAPVNITDPINDPNPTGITWHGQKSSDGFFMSAYGIATDGASTTHQAQWTNGSASAQNYEISGAAYKATSGTFSNVTVSATETEAVAVTLLAGPNISVAVTETEAVAMTLVPSLSIPINITEIETVTGLCAASFALTVSVTETETVALTPIPVIGKGVEVDVTETEAVSVATTVSNAVEVDVTETETVAAITATSFTHILSKFFPHAGVQNGIRSGGDIA